MSAKQRAENPANPGHGAGGSRVVTSQLRLVGRDDRPDWVLDERTRRVGRQGVAQAREILRRAHPPRPVSRAS